MHESRTVSFGQMKGNSDVLFSLSKQKSCISKATLNLFSFIAEPSESESSSHMHLYLSKQKGFPHVPLIQRCKIQNHPQQLLISSWFCLQN